MAVYADEPRLSPGLGFHLNKDGEWGVAEIPPKVVEEAAFSGYLTIDGYKSSVFEMPDGSQWGQKSTGTAISSLAKRVARLFY
jgi:hypothetical protein